MNVQNSLYQEDKKIYIRNIVFLLIWCASTSPYPLSQMKLTNFTKIKLKLPAKFW
jgi:hypothetical protein